MSEVNFYHLTRATLEQALPELLEKTLARGWRAVVMTSTPERTESLAQFLWTYRGETFLPHGTAKDGRADQQPIWLTDQDERPNAADVLFLTDGARSAHLEDYTRICVMFDGNSDEALEQARALFREVKAQGHDVSYWQQTDRSWSKSQ